MIIAILIITCLSLVVNFILLMGISKNQETNFQIFSKVQGDQWDEIIQIGRAVRAIDRKLDESVLIEHKKNKRYE